MVEVNHQQAADMRAEHEAKKRWFESQREDFLEQQRDKVELGHQQTVERAAAIEALKSTKRVIGAQMRVKLEKKWKEEKQKKRDYVEKAHSGVFDARQKKVEAVAIRKQIERENAVKIGEAAKVARAERREQAKATVRREEQAARDFTARVRHETRPEVRQESKNLFQQQRDAVAEAARVKLEHERTEVQAQRTAYLNMANKTKGKVAELHAASKASLQALAEKRKADAWTVRQALGDEFKRKISIEEEGRQVRKALHDDIRNWKLMSVIDPDTYQDEIAGMA